MAENETSRTGNRWACTVCGERGADYAPSGRCVTCEDRADVPVAGADAGDRVLRQIGDVANLVGLSLRSVRHYEDAGLVLPAARTTGGFRLYDDEAIARLRLIMQMKPLGFSLEEMRLLIEARTALAAGPAEEATRRELQDRVAMFAVAAGEKCEHLRASLAIAEEFSRTLRGEVDSFGD